jgi:putative ABC transport system permease protein
MLGQTARQQLFGAEEAVGRDIRINKQIFRVTVVLAPKGQSATGQDQDDTVCERPLLRRFKPAF